MKKWSTEKFVTLKTAAEVEAEAAEQKQYDDPNAVTFAVYCKIKGYADLTRQAMMLAYTKVKQATVADWDAIFEKF